MQKTKEKLEQVVELIESIIFDIDIDLPFHQWVIIEKIKDLKQLVKSIKKPKEIKE